jgi:hypothetical protein
LAQLLQGFQALRLERIQIEYGWKRRASLEDVNRVLPTVLAILKDRSRRIESGRPSAALHEIP